MSASAHCPFRSFQTRLPHWARVTVALLLALATAKTATIAATPPVGRWEASSTAKVKMTGLRGSIIYTFAINLKPGATGNVTASMEYQGDAITEGRLKGNSYLKAVIARPISKVTSAGSKLYLYSGGDFKLIVGEPKGYGIKEYATVGGLFPEVTIDKLLTSFYGVMIFNVRGDDLVFVGKAGSKEIVWKKIR